MIEAVQLWNEPNNRSHWDIEADTSGARFARMVTLAAQSVRQSVSNTLCILGGLSPIDPVYLEGLGNYGVLDHVDAIALHGYPLDWNLWRLDDWSDKIASIRLVTNKPIWITEGGASSFGADEAQAFVVRRMAEMLIGKTDRLYWHSLLDLPPTWPADTNRKESEGSAYYRHFYQGIVRADNTPKPAADVFRLFTPQFGISQNFRMDDPRLPEAVAWIQHLGVERVRTTLRWPDSEKPGGWDWFDRLLSALAPFDVTLTLCFTPPSQGDSIASLPHDDEAFARFAQETVRRYAPKPGILAGAAR